jgi:hypothetical protein
VLTFAHHPDADGLVWTSRQCDPEICLILFGDRIAEADFNVLQSRRISAEPGLLLELRAYGHRAGITIVN